MKNYIYFTMLAAVLLTSGCSAALVPYTSDPVKKVDYAKELASQGRNIPAAKLLKEVQETTPTDVAGFLLRGESHFLYMTLIDGKNTRGFQERVDSTSQDVNTHYELALKDYLTAKSIVESNDDSVKNYGGGKNFALSNIEWRKAQLYWRKGEAQLACKSMDESLKFNEIATKNLPTAKVEINPRYKSYAEMIAANKKFMSCQATISQPNLESPLAPNADALARAKGCMACHSASEKAVGPSLMDISKRHRDDPNGIAILVQSILEGSKNLWGRLPMPGMAKTVSREDANALAKWIMNIGKTP